METWEITILIILGILTTICFVLMIISFPGFIGSFEESSKEDLKKNKKPS